MRAATVHASDQSDAMVGESSGGEIDAAAQSPHLVKLEYLEEDQMTVPWIFQNLAILLNVGW